MATLQPKSVLDTFIENKKTSPAIQANTSIPVAAETPTASTSLPEINTQSIASLRQNSGSPGEWYKDAIKNAPANMNEEEIAAYAELVSKERAKEVSNATPLAEPLYSVSDYIVNDWGEQKWDPSNTMKPVSGLPSYVDESGQPLIQTNPTHPSEMINLSPTAVRQPEREKTFLGSAFDNISNAIGSGDRTYGIGYDQTGEIPEGEVAWTRAQAPLNQEFDPSSPQSVADWYSAENMTERGNQALSKAALDILGLNAAIREERSDNASKNAEWDYNIEGIGRFTEQELNDMMDNVEWESVPEGYSADVYIVGWNLPSGEFMSFSDLENAETSWSPAAEGQEADNYSSDGTPFVLDYVILPSGQTLSRDEFYSRTEATVSPELYSPEMGGEGFSYYLDLGNGQKITSSDLVPVEQGGGLSAVQSNVDTLFGLWNGMNKVDPSAPWKHIGDAITDPNVNFDFREVIKNLQDVVPFTSDMMTASLPYFIPNYNWATVAANVMPALDGLNPWTINKDRFTFADETLSNSQNVGNIMSAPMELISEKIGGIVPGFRMKTPRASGRYAPAKTFLRAGTAEGLEEILSSATEMLAEDGFRNYGMNFTLDENGNKIPIPTSSGERALNVGGNLAEGFAGGAYLGGLLAAPNVARDYISGKYKDSATPGITPKPKTHEIPDYLLPQFDIKED